MRRLMVARWADISHITPHQRTMSDFGFRKFPQAQVLSLAKISVTTEVTQNPPNTKINNNLNYNCERRIKKKSRLFLEEAGR